MGNVDIPKWLKDLPSAPEFHPTDTEFADPIAYISKIEKQASAFGICKVIPPLPKPSKNYVFTNLNHSLLENQDLAFDVNFPEIKTVSGENAAQGRAVFTTRQQELGQDRKGRTASGGGLDATGQPAPAPATKKQVVWQSGEAYTLQQFESKSKAFSRTVLGRLRQVTPLAIETLFWKAASEKPIYVEYANDLPGSAFGEPEGLLRYSHPRKKRRTCGPTHRGRSYMMPPYVSSGGINTAGAKGEASTQFSCQISEQQEESSDPLSSSCTESLRCTPRRGLCANAEVEGTAGWKLSNSPWNLQVIAHSAGSLTRFMSDGIPGVTSPMVYIGMLFSWFAWHVEDHELHSLNFLHTGSPKTWYAVPGDYALAFEEVIRAQAYGGDIDHLAALQLLGEKTTLLSPEMVTASGIPCCRLVQNPGEFVVTFPRAYHVGFSHGFNCGEAANFGTPQWLSIAKEAAVRRAAMDHLPMLSHQQLLYLLTMSFISRVPRSLLPGVRSSRLRNRLKEERELLVKKAFIKDVLKENKLLNTLLRRDSSFHAVLWKPDSLPSFCGDSVSQTETIPAPILTKDPDLSVQSSKTANKDTPLLTSLTETLDDLYLDSSDLCCDFQFDSGTLPCVACGILGYPFMSVIQPSKKASVEIFHAEHLSVSGVVDIARERDSSHLLNNCNISTPETNEEERWSAAEVLRPRIFCLEHAVQIEELLRPKGGAKMLVICHSDFQKIRPNAAAVAEEITIPFNSYKDVRLESASTEELNLIDVAIDNEQLSEFQNDWTSRLGINLRVSVKARKGSLSKKIEHALNLDCLHSIMAPVSRVSNIKWWSRKSRTKRGSKQRKIMNSYDGTFSKIDEKIYESDCRLKAEGKTLLQYSRRKYKTKLNNAVGAKFASGRSIECLPKVAVAAPGEIDASEENELGAICYKAETDCVELGSSDLEVPEANRNTAGYLDQSDLINSHPLGIVVPVNLPSKSKTSDSVIVREAFISTSGVLTLDEKARVCEGTNKADEHLDAERCFSSPAISVTAAEITGDSMIDINDCKAKTGLTYAAGASDNSASDEAWIHVASHTPENLVDSETRKLDCISTCMSTTTMEVELPIHQERLGSSQTGAQASSLVNSNLEENSKSMAKTKMTSRNRSKRVREVELQTEVSNTFVRSPCEGLRPRLKTGSRLHNARSNFPKPIEDSPIKKNKKSSVSSRVSCSEVLDSKSTYMCNLGDCQMRFTTRAVLSLHKLNRCHYKERGKRSRSHKNVLLHQQAHDDDRPLNCTWKDCSIDFQVGVG